MVPPSADCPPLTPYDAGGGPKSTAPRGRPYNPRATAAPEISYLANVDAEDQLIPRGDKRNLFNAGNQMWHSDSSFKRVPAHASLLAAREVPPEGGETEFASMRVGYEELAAATRERIEGK